MFLERLRNRLASLYHQANKLSGGRLGILELAIQRFNHLRGPEAAASIAYFAIFSFFPLMLLLVAIVGYTLASGEPVNEVLDFLTQVFPAARQFILDNFGQILRQRSTGGLIGLAGLAWAASGVFITLARNINLAWPGASMRSFWQGRLVGLAMIGILILLLFGSLISSVVLDLITRISLPGQGGFLIDEALFWRTTSTVVSWLVPFLIFMVLYYWIPTTRVKWSEAFWGALGAAVAWQLATRAFSWYLTSDFAGFDVVYGSLGTGVALLAWIYLTAYITLLGAHISAAIAQATRLKAETVQFEEEEEKIAI